MAERGLSFEDIGARLDTSRTTVWRWAKEQWRLDPGKIEALSEAIGLESPVDLYKPPGRASIDGILSEASHDDYETALQMARRLAKRSAG